MTPIAISSPDESPWRQRAAGGVVIAHGALTGLTWLAVSTVSAEPRYLFAALIGAGHAGGGIALLVGADRYRRWVVGYVIVVVLMTFFAGLWWTPSEVTAFNVVWGLLLVALLVGELGKARVVIVAVLLALFDVFLIVGAVSRIRRAANHETTQARDGTPVPHQRFTCTACAVQSAFLQQACACKTDSSCVRRHGDRAGEELANMLLDLSATMAAHSVLRPLCLLMMSAAQQPVRWVPEHEHRGI